MANPRATSPPLDEQVFSSPGLLASWGATNGPTSDNILFYFAHSPFFDRTSNNATLLNQAQYNPALAAIVSTRASFESHLRSMAGLEFVIAHDPTTTAAGPAGIIAGPWTIRKQVRRKDGGGARPGDDSVEVLADYFVVGDRIFQAPTLGAVLGSRLLATAKALVTLVGKAGECAEFDPSRGHVYPAAGMVTTNVRSGSGAGTASRGMTPIGALGEPGSQNGFENGDGGNDDDDDDYNARHEANLLAETFRNTARYGKEYMDEHPLVGEPGSFVIQKTKDLNVPSNGLLGGRKGVTLPNLMVKTDLASAVNKREKGGDKSPLSPTGTGATKKRKKDRTKGQTPKEPKTPGGA